ncbi:hypothetical protein YP76_04780 [Sphingobium chungbukense]|uniref:RNA polymerase alpha subunit C-terminal domain-containing protein n=2 Tax=Sphingobium chungbukense TaxID=56193 RepID=A0A0M3AZH0_9SPHN|nr:hypothetical protein YP76_04780 [Sphingobium chungbukense]
MAAALRGDGLSFVQVGKRMGCSATRAVQLVERHRMRASEVTDFDLNTPIHKISREVLPVRVKNALINISPRSMDVTLSDVLSLTDAELLRSYNLGRVGLSEIKDAIDQALSRSALT